MGKPSAGARAHRRVSQFKGPRDRNLMRTDAFSRIACNDVGGNQHINSNPEAIVRTKRWFRPLNEPHDPFISHVGDDDEVSWRGYLSEHELDLPGWVAGPFPDFFPSIPEKHARRVNIHEPNPLLNENGVVDAHPAFQRRSGKWKPPATNVVNALVKARFGSLQSRTKPVLKIVKFSQPASNALSRISCDRSSVPLLPPSYGSLPLFHPCDRELARFFMQAICAGRTLVPQDNLYLHQIIPMAASSDLVRHAMLALAASYVLDFEHRSELRSRAEKHHKSAVQLFGEQIRQRVNYDPGQEFILVVGTILYMHQQVINWEVDWECQASPRWYRALKLGEKILDASDPGLHYHDPKHVQAVQVRIQLGMRVCLGTVISACVSPLDLQAERCSYPWLLEGEGYEQRRIDGFAGLSPNLMHFYAKVTSLCVRSQNNPTSPFIKAAGTAIAESLENFKQWSRLSRGYDAREDLLEACEADLDERGHVKSAKLVTLLTAESYVVALQIYLSCRLFRRARSDPLVQSFLKTLVKIMDLQPTSGHLYTAQHSLASMVLACVVMTDAADRACAAEWFANTTAESRGNVPPAWCAVQHIWRWLDVNESSTVVIGDRAKLLGWWEIMVEEIHSKQGRLNLS